MSTQIIKMIKQKVLPEAVSQLPTLIKTMTLDEIGAKFGVSRERIRQLLVKQGIRAGRIRRQYNYICIICHRGVQKNRKPIDDLCSNCRIYKKREQAGLTSGKMRKHEMTLCTRCKKRYGKRSGLCNSCYVYNYGKTHPAYRQKQIAQNKVWRNKNLEHVRAYKKKYAAAHREYHAAKQREYYQRRKLAQSLRGGEKDGRNKKT